MLNWSKMRQICGVFFGKDEILVKLWFKDLNYHNFHILIVTNFFSTNKQYMKVKLMQNETNLWSILFGKDEILVKLWFKGLNYHNFHIFYYN